jgi:glycosyltransferase involved in cell wall biosynthesis
MYGEGKNPVLRAFRYLLCEIVQLHYMLWKDYDVAFIDSTPPIQGLKLPIVLLFRKKGIVHNVQDLFPETLSGTGLAKKGGILWKIGMWVSNVTFRNSDKIIAVSNDIKNSMVARGVPAEKIEVVYNWVDEKAVQPVAKENNPLFEEFCLSRDQFTVVYAGNLGNAQNIGIVLDGAKELPDVQFAVFGSGGLEENVRKRIKEENITNVHLNPLQPVERVSYVYSLGDACIVSCKEGLGGSAMPSKSWSIMSCGRPVVASFDEGELKEILEKNKCGVFSHAGNVHEFVSAIKSFAENPARCTEMGKNARQFILDNLTKEVGAKKYVDIIKSVVKK